MEYGLQPSLVDHSQLPPQKINPLILFDKMHYSCNPRAIRKLEAVTANMEIGLPLILRTAYSPGDMVTTEELHSWEARKTNRLESHGWRQLLMPKTKFSYSGSIIALNTENELR